MIYTVCKITAWSIVIHINLKDKKTFIKYVNIKYTSIKKKLNKKK